MDFSYQNVTTLHTLALVLFGLASVWMLLAPRHLALVSVLVLCCFVSPAQRLVLGGLDLTLTRMLVVIGLARLIARGEFAVPRLFMLDWVLLAWAATNTAAYTLLYGSVEALVNRLGWAYDVVGLYFVFRALARDRRDVDTIVQALLWLSLPVAAFFMLEKLTSRNVFAMFGGVAPVTLIREGRLRCQGAFAHPILAGTFWAVVLPLFIAEFWRRRARRSLVLAGTGAALFIVVASASSTPAMAVIVVVLGFLLYQLRRWIPVMAIGVAVTLVVLHFYRDKPVWHLLARIDLSGGSTGWHRYRLIDGAIDGFGYWWFVGAPDTEFIGAGVRDITNQYLIEGFRGGLLSLLLFLLVIGLGFATVHRALRRCRGDRFRTMQTWAHGVALAAHCSAFWGVSYFGQMVTLWYLQLALIGGLPVIAGQAAVLVQSRTTAVARAALS